MKRTNVTRSSLPNFYEYIDKIKQLWDSRVLTNGGTLHNELETKLCKYLGISHTTLFSNGHLALENALQLLKNKGEIITTPFTFASTTQAIVRTGNIPVFCDIKNDYTIDESSIESLITEKTVAILPVHVYGNLCNVETIETISKKFRIPVIYDAAHVFGVKYKGIGVGAFGDLSMFSFHATKVFHTIEGGALTYNNPEYEKRLISMRNFGQVTFDTIEYISGNAKMDEFRAAMGLCMLDIVDDEIKKRKMVYDRYVLNLSNCQGIDLNIISNELEANYAYFPVLFRKYALNRDEIYDLLLKNNIMARKYFYPLTSSFVAYRDLFPIQRTPNAEFISNNILCLPLYADLELLEVDRICKIIIEGGQKR